MKLLLLSLVAVAFVAADAGAQCHRRTLRGSVTVVNAGQPVVALQQPVFQGFSGGQNFGNT